MSSVLEIPQNRDFLQTIRDGWSHGPNINLLTSLPSYSESSIPPPNEISFDKIFHEPLGYYLIKSFLVLNNSDDKAVFVSDVELYKSLTDPSARIHISKKIFHRYCSTNNNNSHQIRGISVFESSEITNNQAERPETSIDSSIHTQTMQTATPHFDELTLNDNYLMLASESRTNFNHPQTFQPNIHSSPSVPRSNTSSNAIDVSGQCIDKCYYQIYKKMSSSLTIFDGILDRVLFDLRNNVFPLFLQSPLYKLYIQSRQYIMNSTPSFTVDTFSTLRVLGRGAFGFVNAVIKKNTGCIYAMKCINKNRVMATDSVETIMSERNFLADMDSKFVTGLKYATMDENTLYLIIDLMVGGDLKFHLNKEGRFDRERSRFYAAEVLLGLQHIHSKGIIYRDIKLENVLLGSDGHCKISDLGLAVRSKTKVRGYAGTPGYTAPEVCLQQRYDKKADLFSFGVMVYRFLSGRKPFQSRSKTKENEKKKKKKDGHRTGNELDKNVVSMEPEYPDRYFNPSARSLLKGLMCKNPKYRLSEIEEVKNHPWFTTKIDFGLLESGNLTPPYTPNQDEINADSLRHIGRPTNDEKYKNVKITKAFEKSLCDFPYFSKNAMQREIVDVFENVSKYYDFEAFVEQISSSSKQQTAESYSLSELASITSFDEIEKYTQAMMEKKEKNDLDAFIPSYYLMDDPMMSGNDNNTVSRASSHESSSEMGAIGHHYNANYSMVNNTEISSSSKVKVKRTLTASNNNRTTSQEKESSHRNITESSVSHSNDAVDVDDKYPIKTANKNEMKPIKEDKKSGLIERDAPPKNTNQCLRCVIL